MRIIFAGLICWLLLWAVPVMAQVRQWSEPVTGMKFVWIPGGTYFMGQTESEKDGLIKVLGLEKYNCYCADETPRHQVAVAGFWVGQYEVTNQEYRCFQPEHNSKSFKGFSLDGARQPVVEVSWSDAVAYAGWLAKVSGRDMRLPSELEWEYACRAGTSTIRYWGNSSCKTCVYANVADLSAKKKWSTWRVHNCNDGFPATSPVGTFKPNAFALYDMLGNVWEWCGDVYGGDSCQEEKGDVDKHQSISLANYRIARGSCWDNPARYVRCASRNKRKPDARSYNIGFRLVIVPSNKK